MSDWELRALLLVLGIIVLFVIYFLGRKKDTTDVHDFGAEDDPLEDVDKVSLSANTDDAELSSDQLGRRAQQLHELVKEEAGFRTNNRSAGASETTAFYRAGNNADAQPTDENLIILHVAAKPPAVFEAARLMVVFNEIELEYGEAEIFHRYTERFNDKKTLFSVANMVKPGTFKLEKITEFTTPGVSFFMRLPGPIEGLKAFNIMLECAQILARGMEGEVQDQAHRPLSGQAIDHMREEIQLFSLRQERAVGS